MARQFGRNNPQSMLMRDTQPLDGSPGPEDPPLAGKDESHPSVQLDEGKASLALPPADTKRWSSRRKAAVVVATRIGVITREEACQRYMLSDEELAGWEVAFDKSGIPGQRVTSRHFYRAGR
jgi:hypothetical protein